MSEGQEVITFSGDEVERPRLLWERRDGGSEKPDQQEEGGRRHGLHCSPTRDSVDILKRYGQKRRGECLLKEIKRQMSDSH